MQFYISVVESYCCWAKAIWLRMALARNKDCFPLGRVLACHWLFHEFKLVQQCMGMNG